MNGGQDSRRHNRNNVGFFLAALKHLPGCRRECPSEPDRIRGRAGLERCPKPHECGQRDSRSRYGLADIGGMDCRRPLHTGARQHHQVARPDAADDDGHGIGVLAAHRQRPRLEPAATHVADLLGRTEAGGTVSPVPRRRLSAVARSICGMWISMKTRWRRTRIPAPAGQRCRCRRDLGHSPPPRAPLARASG